MPQAFAQLDEFERGRNVGLLRGRLQVLANCSPLEPFCLHYEPLLHAAGTRTTSVRNSVIMRQAGRIPQASLLTIQGQTAPVRDTPVSSSTISVLLAERNLSSQRTCDIYHQDVRVTEHIPGPGLQTDRLHCVADEGSSYRLDEADEALLVSEARPDVGYVSYSGTVSLKLHGHPLDWQFAQIVCEREGATLAVVDTPDKVKALQDLLHGNPEVLRASVLGQQVLVGINDVRLEGFFETSKGAPIENWSEVKAGDTLACMYTVHGSNFLRPMSFHELKAVNGEEKATYREEAVFAILIRPSGLSKPLQLWHKYKEALSEDIFNRFQGIHQADNDLIFKEVLKLIENKIISIAGITPKRVEELSNDVIRKRDYDTTASEVHVNEMEPRLLLQQTEIFHQILSPQLREDRNIALAVASSNSAVTMLSGELTAHSVFKLPLNFETEETSTCNIIKSSNRDALFQQCRLTALNRSLQDIRDNRALMGCVVVLLTGDFLQTLSVIERGTLADEVNTCFKASPLWTTVETLHLITNMRVQLYNDLESGAYAPGDATTYCSIDTVMSTNDSTTYPVEILNSLELSGESYHKLELKIGVPVLLLRNLDAPRLCNGTRLRITELGGSIVIATILTGAAKGKPSRRKSLDIQIVAQLEAQVPGHSDCAEFRPWNNTVWLPNEPDNAAPGEDCVTFHVIGRIRDVPCYYELPYVCERDDP
ncbi:hypothetical protein PR048_028319 [Dryococelus australis]|uniref:ATP-dependent DNA helicase n=1 Tax=Dryococelus australis TaxID=614101 RepID=A0ABQ9GIX5_9NEOP|nr:hypothetical protein PR048_028319 [Dryococelus australis]